LLELFGLWLFTLLCIRAVVALQESTGMPTWVLAAVPCLFIYMPVLLCRMRRVDSYAYRLSIPAFGDGASWAKAAKSAGVLCLVVLLPWLPLYHFYQTATPWFSYEPALGNLVLEGWPEAGVLRHLFKQGTEHLSTLATSEYYLTLVAYQLTFVAVPEEFFYRGYLQTRLNEVYERKFLLFGIPFGHSLWISNLLFAFGHTLVEFKWWHFATFFPGLLFGLLRERTGGVVAGAFFHAACNILVVVLDITYGVSAPKLAGLSAVQGL
jgi:membrane protease YdiL (CAAX protease family)